METLHRRGSDPSWFFSQPSPPSPEGELMETQGIGNAKMPITKKYSPPSPEGELMETREKTSPFLTLTHDSPPSPEGELMETFLRF